MDNEIPLFQPDWNINSDPLGEHPPKPEYVEYENFNHILMINFLLGEQNELLKKQVFSLMSELKSYMEKEMKYGKV